MKGGAGPFNRSELSSPLRRAHDRSLGRGKKIYKFIPQRPLALYLDRVRGFYRVPSRLTFANRTIPHLAPSCIRRTAFELTWRRRLVVWNCRFKTAVPARLTTMKTLKSPPPLYKGIIGTTVISVILLSVNKLLNWNFDFKIVQTT